MPKSSSAIQRETAYDAVEHICGGLAPSIIPVSAQKLLVDAAGAVEPELRTPEQVAALDWFNKEIADGTRYRTICP